MEESAIQHLKSRPEVQKKGPEGHDPRKLGNEALQEHKSALRETVDQARGTEFKMVERYVNAVEEAFYDPIVEIIVPTTKTKETLQEIANRLRGGDFGTMTEKGRMHNVDGEDYSTALMVDDARQRYDFLVKNEKFAEYPPETIEAMEKVDLAAGDIGEGSKDPGKYAELDAALLDLQAVVIETNINQFDMGMLDMALALQLLHDRADKGGINPNTKTDVQYFAASALQRAGERDTKQALAALAPLADIRAEDFDAMKANSLSEVRAVAKHFGASFSKGSPAGV